MPAPRSMSWVADTQQGKSVNNVQAHTVTKAVNVMPVRADSAP